MSLIKWSLLKMKFKHNHISYKTKISLDSVIGKKNSFIDSVVVNSTIGSNCVFKNGSSFLCELDDNVKCTDNSALYSVKCKEYFSVTNQSVVTNTQVGRYTYLAGGNRVFNASIGSFCSIAENVIIGHAEHPLNYLSTSPLFYKRSNEFDIPDFVATEIDEFNPTSIGNDVWIGANAIIKSGVQISDGVVVGAGAIVTKNVEPYAIVAGSPAKTIKYRFDEKTIDELLKMKWWNMPDKELIAKKHLFEVPFNEIDFNRNSF